MKRMEHSPLAYTTEKQTKKFKYRAPLVFSIPRMYEDDYERNDHWYIHLKKMEKKARELKDELTQISKRHFYLYQQTRRMVAESLERRTKQIQKQL